MVERKDAAEKGRLNGWKEIAAFFKRDERSVKRWEQHRGLPIHRIPGGSLVFAYRHELEDWLAKRGSEPEKSSGPDVAPPPAQATKQTLESRPRSRLPMWAVSAAAVLLALFVGYRMIVSSFAESPEMAMARCIREVDRLFPATSAATQTERQLLVQACINAGSNEARTRHTPSQEVADLYLNGVYLWQKRTPDSLSGARQAFDKAIELDPNYGAAHSGLAVTYELLTEFQILQPSEGYPLAKASAEKALALDPSLGDAQSVIADVEFFHELKVDSAMRRFEKAIELSPRSAQVRMWYADALLSMGRNREALREIDFAQSIDPQSSSALAIKGLVLFANGQPKHAEDLLLQVVRNDPEYLTPYENLLRVYLGTQQYEKYIETGEAMFKLIEFEPGLVLADAARKGLAAGGYKGMADALLAAARPIDAAGQMPPYNMAHFYGMAGDWEKAADFLEATNEYGDGSAFLYSIDPAFAEVRKVPGFRKRIAAIGLPVIQ